MKSIKSFWKNSPPEYKDYLFIYLWGVLWPTVYLFITPAATFYIVNFVFVLLWTGVTIVGGITAMRGLLTRDNLLLERFGVTLLMIGPISFAITQFGTMIYKIVVDDPLIGSPWGHVHLIFFALWPFLFLNKRRRQLKSRVELAKQVPLRAESDQ
ncbi:hypothetical protein QEH42_gp102 [Microbacterium phage Pumpernickel]|uniref:Uncharacterized protein n=1 Tax=Microbacterium phage Pumpernickel TaxID=2885983 RepID=A0AAE8Y7I6_9CAUD|nr:hypothetical protein QEH42_gp102 [Microbacterium phage Pumpernickel]UDL15893.1 hypothetical protein SEA_PUMPERNICKEL_102 [Microbacterium phage Pumpernickel]